MVNFPASLDSLANPTATTNRDDPGFQLHTVISTLNDIAELLEAKAGISESSAQDTPLLNTVLTSLTNGKSKWATVVTAMLAANAVTQIGMSTGTGGTSTSTSYFTLSGNGTSSELRVDFTTAGGPLLVLLFAQSFHSGGGQSNFVAVSLDGAAEVGDRYTTAPAASNSFQTVTGHLFTGVSAGSHIVRGRSKTTAATMTMEGRTLIVVELKR